MPVYLPPTQLCQILTLYSCFRLKKYKNEGFLGGSVVKNLPANAGDMGLTPGLGRPHMLQSN